MMSRQLVSLAAATLFTAGARAAQCTSDLLIDNWSNYATAVNSMNDATSGKGIPIMGRKPTGSGLLTSEDQTMEA